MNMGICFRCEKEVSKLFDSIVEEGIVGLCEECLDDDIPLVKRPPEFLFKDENDSRTIRERLSFSAGINPEHHKSFEETFNNKNEQNKELENIINKNIEKDLLNILDKSMFVPNFHWVVMRARRLRKLTLDELARKISEPKELLVFLEQGRVSEKSVSLVKKLELFFGIELFAKEGKEKIKTLNKDVLFDSVFSRAVTIDDLRGLKKREFRQDNQPKNF